MTESLKNGRWKSRRVFRGKHLWHKGRNWSLSTIVAGRVGVKAKTGTWFVPMAMLGHMYMRFQTTNYRRVGCWWICEAFRLHLLMLLWRQFSFIKNILCSFGLSLKLHKCSGDKSSILIDVKNIEGTCDCETPEFAPKIEPRGEISELRNVGLCSGRIIYSVARWINCLYDCLI